VKSLVTALFQFLEIATLKKFQTSTSVEYCDLLFGPACISADEMSH